MIAAFPRHTTIYELLIERSPFVALDIVNDSRYHIYNGGIIYSPTVTLQCFPSQTFFTPNRLIIYHKGGVFVLSTFIGVHITIILLYFISPSSLKIHK